MIFLHVDPFIVKQAGQAISEIKIHKYDIELCKLSRRLPSLLNVCFKIVAIYFIEHQLYSNQQITDMVSVICQPFKTKLTIAVKR